ncbi:RHS repeat-associated core domain-containing protein [Aquimarina longa]|uniref:RHS repeat-associated core domain-containing protein n=1 Tax=Aquimarina longa TaxID=1080221 RepID=UPI00078262C0|nr:RHS repeat-associated core domain-containing protein [Aquimarina longa]
MLLANKHFTPIVGVDIHIVIIPPGIPTPIPHPFIGIVMDPIDYVPVIGSTINVNCVPKGNSGTAGMLGMKAHIPLGGAFAMMPAIGHDSVNFYGSQKVSAEDALFSPSGYMLMTCNDLGMPLAPPSMYLPTSATIPLPGGKPVLVGGPYVPDMMGAIIGALSTLGFGAVMKKLGKLGKKGLKKLNNKVLKKFPATEGLSKKLCKMGFEPVDLITGRMVYEGEDFTLPGIIPITWERNWYSDSSYHGMLGYGMHSNYDLALHIVQEEDTIVMRLPDGRITTFPWLVAEKEKAYNRAEKLTLTCINGTTYTIKNHNNQQTYTFTKIGDDLYKPTRLENPEGLSITFYYNAVQQLEQIKDTAGRILNITSDTAGRIIEITAKHQEEIRTLITYRYNEEGDMTHIIDALGQATVMEYKNHLMIKKTDRNGQAFYWEYNGDTTGAKCIKTWGDDNILSGTLEYHQGYNIITNSLDQQSIYYFNNDNLCTQVIDPMENTIYHEYNQYNELYRDIDEEGNLTGYSYDDRGNLTALHQPDGSVISFVYDQKDRLVLTQYPKGGSIIKAFNEQDQLQSVIGMDSGVTSFTYNKIGLIDQVRDNVGNITELAYDQDHNLTKMTLPNGAESTWQYDPWGRCYQSKNAENHKQHFFYDKLDRIHQIHQADKNTIHLKYNAYNEVLQTKDQRKREINFQYTPMGSLQMREENGKKVHFKYNTEEQLTSITNEHKEHYLFARNPKGEIITETGFDGLVRQYDRDRAGKVLRIKRPDDKFTEYEYDLNGRIIRAEHSDNTWETYSYDQDGNLIEAINQHSQLSLERDQTGRIVTETQDSHTIESKYDALGNRIQINSSLGADINLNRNQLGQIQNISANVSPNLEEETSQKQKNLPWQAQFAYNSIGMETERALPGGVIKHTQYDDAGRPIQQKITVNSRETRHRTYAWNVNDRLTKMVDELTNGVVSYGYDAFNNLASAKYENKQFDYKLPDEVGNLYKTESRSDRKYGKGGQLLEADGNTYKYDKEGNLITKATHQGTYEYQWYGNGMLKSVNTPDRDIIKFEYDALGRRTAKTILPSPFKPSAKKQITRWVWDGNVPLHEWKYDLKDRPQLVVDEFGMLAESKPEPIENLITWIFDEGTFKPTAKIINDETYSIITDYLGTPVEMYNSKGQKTWQVEYDIYGKVRKLVKGSLNDCPFRYQGQYEDVETGLYYNRFRYYSSDTGTYISQDPIGLEGGMPNMYAYVHDSTTWVDPFGLTGIGAWGEKVAANYLSKQGHQILGSVQNASGHGFDLVTKSANGDINIIEVKTSQSKWRSKSNMSRWTNNNIRKISGNTNGRWKNMPNYQKNLMDTIDKANAKGKLKNKLLQINIDQRSIRLKCK